MEWEGKNKEQGSLSDSDLSFKSETSKLGL